MRRHPSSAVALAVIVALALLLASCGDDAPEELGAGTTDPTPAAGATSVVTEGEVPTPSATAVVPTDGGCNAVSAESLLAGPVPTLDELRGQLPLMRGAYGVTSVSLRNDQEALAATLAETYGPLIELSVGNFPYPQDPTGPSADNRCAALPAGEPPPDIEVLDVTVEGDQGASTVSATLANTGQATLHLVPWRVAELTALDSNQLVSAFDGSRTSDDRGSIVLEPGSQTTITAMASTASCDPEVGFELPPGNYEFVLPIYVFDAPASENDTSTTVLIPRIEYAIG